MTLKERLEDLASQVKDGRTPTTTVRDLLSWQKAYRRGYWIVQEIRKTLTAAGLKTEPDFESTYIDAEVSFVPAEPPAPAPEAAPAVMSMEHSEPVGRIGTVAYADPTYRISKLESANRRPVTVPPDAPLAQAATLMLSNDFSQLPAMSGEREVKGVITWSSIGRRLALGRHGTTAQDFMDQHQEIRAESSLFAAIPIITQHGYVLVRSSNNRISGIVTASDLNIQFRQLAEPFLLLGEIENHIRRIIDDRFNPVELASARDPADTSRAIQSVADLTFGEYVRLLENLDRWTQLGLPIDRGTFIEKLETIRRIRNDVMHFDPDGIPPLDLESLRDFVAFLQRLQEMGVA